jgi:hypothetical protein
MLTPKDPVSATPTDLIGHRLAREHGRRLYSGDVTIGFAPLSDSSGDVPWTWDELVHAAGEIADVVLSQGVVSGAYEKLTFLDPSHITCKMDAGDKTAVQVDTEKFLTATREYLTKRGKRDPKNLSLRFWADLSDAEKGALAMTD